jgi:hypothetical protein
MNARRHLQAPGELQDFRRRWIADGPTVRRAVAAALTSTYSVASLRRLATEATMLAAGNSDAASSLEQARQELSTFDTPATDLAPVIVFLAGAGAAALYLLKVEGYTLQPPAVSHPELVHLEAEHAPHHP